MGFSILGKTLSNFVNVFDGVDSKRVYRPVEEMTGKELIGFLTNGVRQVNLIPHSSLLSPDALTNGDILEPDGISEYFTRECCLLENDKPAIKYTCIKDVPSGTKVLIFDSGDTYPEKKIICSWWHMDFYIGESLLKDGTRASFQCSIKDLTLNQEVKNNTYNPTEDYDLFITQYTTSYFIPREIELSAKVYTYGNITVGDVIKVSPPVIVGLNQFADFSDVDEYTLGNTPQVSYSGTMEGYSAQKQSSKMALSKNQTIDNSEPVSFEDALTGPILTEKEAES